MVIARCNIKSPQPQSPLKMFFLMSTPILLCEHIKTKQHPF